MRVARCRAAARAILVAVPLCAGCAAPVMPEARARAQIARAHAHSVVELRQSCYYGDLYDENELWLLSPRPFAHTSHIDDTDGAPLHPTHVRGILPAGTPLMIESITFPDLWNMATRMLTTPRYSTWVTLRGLADAAEVPVGARPFVLVLPVGLRDEAAVEAALAALVSPAGETTEWLRQRRPAVRAAIANKEAVRGMQLAEMLAALGPPPHWFVDRIGTDAAEVAWYEDGEVWLQHDQVVDLRASRALPEPAAAEPDRPH